MEPDALYRQITLTLIERRLTVSTMESCTGGAVASLLTNTEGASATMKGAFVTYSNEAKIRQGVPAEVIDTFGVYSRETADAMAAACADCYGADIGIGITGSLGNPDPNNADSVPGQVYFSIRFMGKTASCFLDSVAAPTRRETKSLVAEAVGRKLLELLCEQCN